MPESGEYGGVTPANLGDLHDVARTAPADGDVLVWNATAGEWEPGAAQSGTSVPFEKILFQFSPGTVLDHDNPNGRTTIVLSADDIVEQVGTDLSVVDGAVVSAAGGQFNMSLYVDLIVADLVDGDPVYVRLSIPSPGEDSGGDFIMPVNLPVGTNWSNPPAQGMTQCGPCAFDPGANVQPWVNLGPIAAGTVTLDFVEFMVSSAYPIPAA